VQVAGYVREAPGRGQSDTAFTQTERIRRWALDTGNDVIAVCQDRRSAASPDDRPGYRALLEIVRSGSADAVVISSLAALSPDKMLQEIMIVDLRNAGATVIATEEADLAALGAAGSDHTRLVVRDVVAKVAEYREAFGLSGEAGIVNAHFAPRDEDDDGHNVVVELIAPTG